MLILHCLYNDIWKSGLPAGEEQQGSASYHFRKLPFGGLIQPEWSDTQIQRFIRAMHFPPFEGAAVAIDGGRRLEISSVQEYRRIQCEGLACAAAVECTAVAAAAVVHHLPLPSTPLQ